MDLSIYISKIADSSLVANSNGASQVGHTRQKEEEEGQERQKRQRKKEVNEPTDGRTPWKKQSNF